MPGHGRGSSTGRRQGKKEPSPWEQAVERAKWEVARSLGVDKDVEASGWSGLPARQAGQIGGKLRGRLRLQLARQIRMSEPDGGPDDPAPPS